jgi:hypothetical protein
MKNCPVCGNEVKGRKDKIYCSSSCRSAQQYEDRLKENVFYFRVDRQLKKNRSLLRKYNQIGKTTLRKEVLLQQGFNPKFFTHFWKNSKGQVYLFCYEYGYLSLKEGAKEKYVLVTWQPYMENG